MKNLFISEIFHPRYLFYSNLICVNKGKQRPASDFSSVSFLGLLLKSYNLISFELLLYCSLYRNSVNDRLSNLDFAAVTEKIYF